MFSHNHNHSTTIVVADQDAALDFYVNTLGWDVAMDAMVSKEIRFLAVMPPEADIQFVLAHPSWFGPNDLPAKETGISLITPDIDATYDFLVERGVTFKQPVTDIPGGAKATWFNDLDGNEFILMAA
ncbi:MAG: VOC family protein [Thermomicrobiales bacterium]